MKLRALLILTFLAAHPAYCGDTTGTITELLMLNDVPDRLFIRVTGSNNSLPSCSVQNNRYVLDTSTNTGKQLYAALLAAKYASATITIHGFGTCNLWGNSEDLRGLTQN